jgi:hypothetical protein
MLYASISSAVEPEQTIFIARGCLSIKLSYVDEPHFSAQGHTPLGMTASVVFLSLTALRD